MKKVIQNPLNLILFIGIIGLYVAFMTLMVFTNTPARLINQLKFMSIVLCFGLALSLYQRSHNKKDSKYVIFALTFTVIADIFLLFTTRHIPGVLSFWLVQLLYLKRYHNRLFGAGIIAVVIAIPLIFLLPFESLHIIAGTYAILIMLCFFATFKTKLPIFNLVCIRLGMLLFILCDVHVALFNLLARSHPYFPIASIAMWFFYLPSQLLLALSASHAEIFTPVKDEKTSLIG